MKDLEPLKNRIKELGRQAAEFSRQAVELTSNGDIIERTRPNAPSLRRK